VDEHMDAVRRPFSYLSPGHSVLMGCRKSPSTAEAKV